MWEPRRDRRRQTLSSSNNNNPVQRRDSVTQAVSDQGINRELKSQQMIIIILPGWVTDTLNSYVMEMTTRQEYLMRIVHLSVIVTISLIPFQIHITVHLSPLAAHEG